MLPLGSSTNTSSRVSISSALRHFKPRRSGAKSDGAMLADSLDRIAELGVSYVSYGAAGGSSGLVVHLGDAATLLQHLDLSHLACGSKGNHPLEGPACQALARTLVHCPSLVRVSLASNGLRDETLQMLVDGLSRGEAPALEELDLSDNCLRSGNLLAQLLASSCKLVSLSIEANELNDLAVMALAAGISMCSRLRRLNLAKNRFGDSGAVAIANSIKYQRSNTTKASPLPLREQAKWLLSLVARQDIRNSSETLSSQFLQHESQGLQHLDLSRTQVSDGGAAALAESVWFAEGHAAGAVRWLNLTDCRVGTRGRAALEQSVRDSQQGIEVFAGALLDALQAARSTDDGATLPGGLNLPAQPFSVQGLALEALSADFAVRFSAWMESHNIAALSAMMPLDGKGQEGAEQQGDIKYANHVHLDRRTHNDIEEVETVASTPCHDQRSLGSLETMEIMEGVCQALEVDDDCCSEESALVTGFIRNQMEDEAVEQSKERQAAKRLTIVDTVKEVERVESLHIVKAEVERWEVRKDRLEMAVPEELREIVALEAPVNIVTCGEVVRFPLGASEQGESTSNSDNPPPQPQSECQNADDTTEAAQPQEEVGKGKGKGKGAPPGKAKGKGAPPSPPKGKGKMARPAGAPFSKRLFWKQLDLDDAQGTIFSTNPVTGEGSAGGELASEASLSSRQERKSRLDTDALERMFYGCQPKISRSDTSSKLLQKLQCKADGSKVLSDNRARNIAIVMRRLSVTPEKLACILQGLYWEDVDLGTDQMELVLEVLPTKEEVVQLRPYLVGDKRKKLRDVEQMLLPLISLERASSRVRVMSCARNVQASFEAACAQLAAIRDACDAIRKSDMLREVMLLALELGNYINHGDSSRGAKAITIGSLLQLRDFKLGRISSLHFLCAQLIHANCSRNAAEILDCELQPAAVAADIPAQGLAQVVRILEHDIAMMQAECEESANAYDDGCMEKNTQDAGTENQSLPDVKPGDEIGEGEQWQQQQQKQQNQRLADAKSGDEIDEGEQPPLEAGLHPEAATTSAKNKSQHEAHLVQQSQQMGLDSEKTDPNDAMQIRGGARQRLFKLQQMMVQLKEAICLDTEETVSQALELLRFCGVALPECRDVLQELEQFLRQLGDFVQVFAQHWKQVQSELPSYQKLFASNLEAHQTSQCV